MLQALEETGDKAGEKVLRQNLFVNVLVNNTLLRSPVVCMEDANLSACLTR